MAKTGFLSRAIQHARELVRVRPVAPASDELYNVWTTLYGTPDVEKLLPTFEQFARNGFSGNSVVFGLMVRRLMLFTEATLALRHRKEKTLDSEAPALGIFREPWPNGVTADLLARMIQDVDLAGNAYVRDAGGDRLERLRPDWVTIVSQVDEDAYGHEIRTVIGYVYEPVVDNARHTEFYTVDEVAHWAPIPDPVANFRGMSWLTPVIREVNADIAMSEHAYAFYMNAATPNLIIKYSQKLKTGQIDRIRDQVAARHTGSANAFSTMVLDEGADPLIVGKDLTDVSFGALQAAGENRLAVAAGVPAIVAGLKEGLNAATMANYREAMQAFANLTMRPLWRSACAALAKLVDIPDGHELWYDTRDIAALQQGEQELASTMQTNAATVSSLISAGYKPDSVVKAVTAGDLTLLKHTGLYSVQLRPPGAQDPAAGANGDPAAGGKPKPGDPNEDPAEDPDEDPNAGTSKQDPNGATRAGWVWDIARGRWRPEMHPRDHRGRFRRVGAVDLLDTVDVKALSHKRLHGLFASVSDDFDAGGDERQHEAALMLILDEMDRREKEHELAALRKENPLAGRNLMEMSDQELSDILHTHADRQDIRLRVMDELNWRRKDRTRAEWAELNSKPLLDWDAHQADTLEQRRIDKLVKSGRSYAEAYAEAYALDDAKLLKEQRASLVDMDRLAGETRRQAVRRAYSEHVYLQYLAAEEATNGYLLSREGKAAGIDSRSLFSGPRSRARKYASEELLRWWGEHGNRITFEEFAAAVYTGDTALLKDRASKSAGTEHGV